MTNFSVLFLMAAANKQKWGGSGGMGKWERGGARRVGGSRDPPPCPKMG